MTHKGVVLKKILLIPALAVLVAASALGGTGAIATAAAVHLHIDKNDPDCSDAGPGTRATPLCSINAGTSRAIAGQTIHIAAGAYRERVMFGHSGTAGHPIVLAAANGVVLSSSSTGIELSGRRWITIRGIAVKGTVSYGIDVRSGSHITIKDVRVSGSGSPISGRTRSGIHFGGTDSLITRVVSHHNTDAGIFLGSAATAVAVRHSTAFANARGYVRAAPGIDIRGVGNDITGNIVHDNEDSGIQVYAGANSNLVAANAVYDNGDHGIDVLRSRNTLIVSNTVVGNMTAGINVEGDSIDTTLANNISVDNALTNTFGQKGNICVDMTSVSGTTVDYDIVFLGSPGTVVKWNGTAYRSIVDLAAETGQESHGLQAEPLWMSSTPGDFAWLRARRPSTAPTPMLLGTHGETSSFRSGWTIPIRRTPARGPVITTTAVPTSSSLGRPPSPPRRLRSRSSTSGAIRLAGT